MIRVLLADDSPTIRTLLAEILESDPEIEVVARATNGREAVEWTGRMCPDLVAMDIRMTVVDGLEATKEIMFRTPTPILILSGSASREELGRSLDTTRAGALMVLPKPDDPSSPGFPDQARRLVTTVKALADVKVVRRRRSERGAPPGPLPEAKGGRDRIVVVGASTGGPAALRAILHDLPPDFQVPVLVVQHIAPGFVEGLADWLNGATSLHVRVARAGTRPEPRVVHLAPDGAHLLVDDGGRLMLRKSTPLDGHCPAITHLFSSAALAFGSGVTAVLLTGMGRDGVEGLRSVQAAGGRTLVQDEATSAVFGMPGAAVRARLADVVLPLDRIASQIVEFGGTQSHETQTAGR